MAQNKQNQFRQTAQPSALPRTAGDFFLPLLLFLFFEAFLLVIIKFVHTSDVNQARSQDREAQELDSHLNNHVLVGLSLNSVLC